MKSSATTFSAIVLLMSVAMSIVSVSAEGAYGDAPMTKPDISYKVKEKEIPKPIAVQGLIYCKSGSKFIPLKGATAKITCLVRNHNGIELAPFFVSSCPTDDKGYFLAKLSFPLTKYFENVEWELEECKAFLENSPSKECKFPLDINGGITGVHVISSSAHRFLKNVNLYSIKPFFYTSDEPKRIANNKSKN